jgi:hypothetical protein
MRLAGRSRTAPLAVAEPVTAPAMTLVVTVALAPAAPAAPVAARGMSEAETVNVAPGAFPSTPP